MACSRATCDLNVEPDVTSYSTRNSRVREGRAVAAGSALLRVMWEVRLDPTFLVPVLGSARPRDAGSGSMPWCGSVVRGIRVRSPPSPVTMLQLLRVRGVSSGSRLWRCSVRCGMSHRNQRSSATVWDQRVRKPQAVAVGSISAVWRDVGLEYGAQHHQLQCLDPCSW